MVRAVLGFEFRIGVGVRTWVVVWVNTLIRVVVGYRETLS